MNLDDKEVSALHEEQHKVKDTESFIWKLEEQEMDPEIQEKQKEIERAVEKGMEEHLVERNKEIAEKERRKGPPLVLNRRKRKERKDFSEWKEKMQPSDEELAKGKEELAKGREIQRMQDRKNEVKREIEEEKQREKEEKKTTAKNIGEKREEISSLQREIEKTQGSEAETKDGGERK